MLPSHQSVTHSPPTHTHAHSLPPRRLPRLSRSPATSCDDEDEGEGDVVGEEEEEGEVEGEEEEAPPPRWSDGGLTVVDPDLDLDPELDKERVIQDLRGQRDELSGRLLDAGGGAGGRGSRICGARGTTCLGACWMQVGGRGGGGGSRI